MNYNDYFPGVSDRHAAAAADGQVTFADGTPTPLDEEGARRGDLPHLGLGARRWKSASSIGVRW
jgi:hypothetical protein